MARRYGRCCMYGPNYVKLSRVFAVQLFRMLIGHYAALPPVRSDPHWSHIHAITASIRLALTHTLQYPTNARDSNLDSGNHDMSRLSALAYLNDAPIHGLTDKPLAYFQRIWVVPWPSHQEQTHNTTTLATQTPSRPPNYVHASPGDASRSPHIHLTTAPFCSART
jgi:hypothetical protein